MHPSSPTRSWCWRCAAAAPWRATIAADGSAADALAALAPNVRAIFSGADGKPDAAFDKIYDALSETQPSL